jgi:HSP90 family molecular chaperone
VEVEDEVQASPESGLSDSVQKITVTDHGPGMSEDDIRRYLLQVGRSYYRTSEFRRRYPFTASSRFGIGFLSVFAVSDHVEVVTKVAQASESGATRVVLTGPRNYLLTERCDRKEVGTSVAVTVRDRLDEEALIEAIQRWCSHVEIPIIVRAGGRDVRIFREDDVETDNCVVSPDGKYEL